MSHSKFIDDLGGGTQVAEQLSALAGEDVARDAVYKWIERDLIPWRWRAHLIAIAHKQGKTVPKDFLPGIPA